MPIIYPSRQFEGSDLGLEDSVILSGADVSEVLKEELGNILWIGEHEGFCWCPGSHLHTARDGRKDCKLYVSPVPTLSCFHSSCREVVEATTKRLRHLLMDVTKQGKREKLTEEQEAEMARVRAREALRQRAATSRQSIILSNPWPADGLPAASPSSIPRDASEHWREIMGFFSPDDVVWAGTIYDSGRPQHSTAFRRAVDWLKFDEVPGQFTCPSAFKPGSFSRTNANVERRPFFVVESDELDRNSIAAVLRWIRQEVGLRLRAIVDTAGKSLHGWFEYPPPEELEDLRIVLPELGCDPKMFGASQPCRLPGAMRDGKVQKLLFLDKGGVL